MPVNIDTVYQTVQALANKEQRGYLTPQEFNLFANQAQSDIFEQYFYDLNAFRLAKPQQRGVGDSVTFVQHKIANTEGVSYVNNEAVILGTDLPTTGHTGQIFVNNKTLRLSTEDGYQRIQVWSGGLQVQSGVTCEHVTGGPALCFWGYIVVNEKAVYNPVASRDFGLDVSEQADLVAKIMKLAGISIESQELYQAGAAEEALNMREENK